MNQSQKTVRKRATKSKYAWVLVLLLGLPQVLILIRRFSDLEPSELPVWLGILAAVGIGVGLLALWMRPDNVVKSMGSRLELGSYVSSLKGFRRWNLVWCEYALARAHLDGDTEAGPYNIGPAWLMLQRELQLGTRTYGRLQLLAVACAWLVVTIPLVLTSAPSDRIFWVIGTAVLFSPAVPTVLLLHWWKSRRPLGVLGRRVEIAVSLESEERWRQLLEIALTHKGIEQGATM